MRGRVVAWRCNCSSRVWAAIVVVMLLILLGMTVVVESTRVREMVVAAIDLQGETSSVVGGEYDSVGTTTTTTTTTRAMTTRATSNEGHSRGDGVVEDPVWDMEDDSPPAQRQRDRSLWGMSKRLVPTGPNPLHN